MFCEAQTCISGTNEYEIAIIEHHLILIERIRHESRSRGFLTVYAVAHPKGEGFADDCVFDGLA